MSRITINGITMDPLGQQAALAAENLLFDDASSSDYILIQGSRSPGREEKAELQGLGVEILEYVPEDTYLCRYRDTDLDRIRALPWVNWVDVYLQGFKVAPSLLRPGAGSVGPEDLLEMRSATTASGGRTPRQVDVVFHAPVDPDGLRERLAGIVGLDPQELPLQRHKLRVTVRPRQLQELAGLDEVRHIEEVVPMQLHNDRARTILNLETSAFPATVYDGRGQTVAVADTGFDRGSSSDVHPAFSGRVARLYALGRSSANDPDGHGTHVAGSVLGDGTSAALGHRVQGTAPAARLVLQSVLDGFGGLGGLPADLSELFRIPYENDAVRIHTNSWGSIRGDGSYNTNSYEVDDFVWTHRDCVICFSAGNEGEDRNANGVVDAGSITPPGTAKNCITIGASENDRPAFRGTYRQWFGFRGEPIASDRLADNPEGMVAFSSRGPTADGRVKPDLVAPGSFILSARSRDTDDRGWSLSQDPAYFYVGGTSMATPLVAGCVALARQFLASRRGLTQPSAALVKAILINGARPLAGQYVPSETGATPNHASGFGLVDMAASVAEDLDVHDEGTPLDTGEERSLSVTVSAGASLKVTLVWSDPPGATLQNDLDLIVRSSSGEERHGNRPPGSVGFDRRNNVEQVGWEGLPQGTVAITVRAHRIPLHPQSYALVIRRSATEPALPAVTVNGPEVLGRIDPAGEEDLYRLEISEAARYTIETSGTTDTFLSLFGPDDTSTLVAADDDSGPGTLSALVVDLTPGTYTVQIRHFSPRGRGAYGLAVRSHRSPGPTPLVVDGPELQGDIGRPGESDLHSFVVQAQGVHVIETTGSTDTFLSLYGPDDDGTLLAQDDDGGPGLLSRIRRDLSPAIYHVRVRHYSPGRTGAYGLRVRRES